MNYIKIGNDYADLDTGVDVYVGTTTRDEVSIIVDDGEYHFTVGETFDLLDALDVALREIIRKIERRTVALSTKEEAEALYAKIVRGK